MGAAMSGSTSRKAPEAESGDPAPIPELFVVFLGGDLADGRMGEDHEVVFFAAADLLAARRAAKRKWRGSGRAHIDAVAQIDTVDGFDVRLVANAGTDGDQVALDSTYVR